MSGRIDRRDIHSLLATALVFVWPMSEAVSATGTPKASSSPKPSGNIGEAAAVAAADILLLPDHLFMKSATAMSPNYLEKVAVPSSRFHADYIKYKQKQISRAELVARLPHVAMIGDSLSKDAYVSSIPSTFWRARTRRGRDWFLDTDPSPDSIYSVFERLQEITPLVATEYSGVGALVDPGNAKASFVRQLVRTRNFSGQVDQLLKSRRYPDLILLWIGHNNLDWAAGISAAEREHPEKHFEQL